MTTALQYINRLRVMMREEQIEAIETSDDLTQDLLISFNDAKDTILNDYHWSFRERDDGIAWFPKKYTGDEVTTAFFSEVVTIDSQSVHTYYVGLAASRFQVSSDANFPDISYPIVSANSVGGNTELTLSTLWFGETGVHTSPTWVTFAYETALPATVGPVLSVRDEANNRQLSMIDKNITLDRAAPRLHQQYGEPTEVYIGGTTTTTITTDFPTLQTGTATQQVIGDLHAGLTGTRMAVWPIPEVTTHIRYSYLYKYADVSATTDAIVGVPRQVEQIIVQKAFHALLAGNNEADTVRARELARSIEVDLSRAKAADARDPMRRRVMRPVGALAPGPTNARWDTSEVPSP